MSCFALEEKPLMAAGGWSWCSPVYLRRLRSLTKAGNWKHVFFLMASNLPQQDPLKACAPSGPLPFPPLFAVCPSLICVAQGGWVQPMLGGRTGWPRWHMAGSAARWGLLSSYRRGHLCRRAQSPFAFALTEGHSSLNGFLPVPSTRVL